ncbi:MAG: ABC transporter substrate-binding protein [Dorea sp.]|nr:ABC transporter substrate-binding protein [Dorea sp.]
MKKRVLALLLVTAMMAALAGCASNGKEESEKSESRQEEQKETTEGELVDVSFRLNYTADGLHAPFYYALEKGYYEEAGLNVTIGEGNGAGTTAKLIGTGDADIGFTDSASVASAIAEGIPVKIVCPIYAVNAFGAIALKDSGIQTMKDLEGKKVGIATGDGPSNLFAAAAAANDIDVNKVEFVSMDANSKETSLMKGDVDAILAGCDSDAVALECNGYEVNAMRYSDCGAATVGLSLVANPDFIAENSEIIEKFISATLKGWDECRTNGEEAVEIFMKNFPTADENVVKGSLAVALDCLFDKDAETLAGLTKEDWNNCRDLLVNYLGVDESIQAEELYTFECIPKELPAR